MDAVNNPEDESAGTRKLPFSGELWIEREDFEETPPPKYFRLYPGNSVRLRYGYIVNCTGCDKDEAGNVIAVHCTYDPATKGGNAPDNTKVQSTIHWVSALHAIPIEARLYDYLFAVDKPMEVKPRPDGSPGEFTDNLNPASLEIISGAWAEPVLAEAKEGDRFQFERLGYFSRDPDNGAPGPDAKQRPVFNKTVGLRDTWAKVSKSRD
jgi:glutaminyl-tRNA synthetase